MYTRIVAVVTAVIVVLTAVLAGLGWGTLQSRQTEVSREALRKEAREIAFLASQNTTFRTDLFYNRGNVVREYLNWKASEVYEEYGAFIVVVDPNGRMMDNLAITYANQPDLTQSITGKDIVMALTKVLSGEEIDLTTYVDGQPMFTVGVPFVQNGQVLGSVLIQTPQQVIEGGGRELLGPFIAAALVVALVAGTVLFLYVRRVMKPLIDLTGAAQAMAEGNFAVRVSPQGTSPEVAELAGAFNTMTEQLAHTETSRREFVANVSHELRSPITAISGYVEGMLDGTIPPEKQNQYLGIVRDESRRLSKLIGELLALSRLERDDAALDMKDFDICDLLERVLMRRTGDLESRSMDVQCDFDPEPCLVRADPARIEQVVINLLDNAIKFTPNHGCITLRVAAANEVCTVTVQDNGVGIQPEDRSRVFERFFTADRAHTSGTGTGLGLSICQRIMEMHGQRIKLLDTQEGAAFAFTLAMAKRGE